VRSGDGLAEDPLEDDGVASDGECFGGGCGGSDEVEDVDSFGFGNVCGGGTWLGGATWLGGGCGGITLLPGEG
jgi:hypothetical protein